MTMQADANMRAPSEPWRSTLWRLRATQRLLSNPLMTPAFNTLEIPICGIDYLLEKDRARAAIGADCLVLSSRLLGAEAARGLVADWKGALIDLDDLSHNSLKLSVLSLPRCESNEAPQASSAKRRSFRAVAKRPRRCGRH